MDKRKDDLYSLFQDACPEPIGEKEFTPKLMARVEAEGRKVRKRTAAEVAFQFLLSPLPMLICAVALLLIYKDTILAWLLKLASRYPSQMSQFVDLDIIGIIMVGIISLGCIAIWVKMLEDDSRVIDINSIRQK